MGQTKNSFASLMICILLVFLGNVRLGESRVLGRQLLSTDSDETFDINNNMDKTTKSNDVSPNEISSSTSAANSRNKQSEYSNYLPIGATDYKNQKLMKDMLSNMIDKIMKETLNNITNLSHANQTKSNIQNYGNEKQQVYKKKDPSILQNNVKPILQNNVKPTVDEKWSEYKNANKFFPRGNMNLQFRDENARTMSKNDNVIRTIDTGNENKRIYNRKISEVHKTELVDTTPHITRPDNGIVVKTAGGKQFMDKTSLIGKSVDMTGIRNDYLKGKILAQNAKLEAYSRNQAENLGKRLQIRMHESYNGNTSSSRTFQEGSNQKVMRGSVNIETTTNENININTNGKLLNTKTSGTNVEKELGIMQQGGAQNSKVKNLEKSTVSKNSISNNKPYEYMRVKQNTINEVNMSTFGGNKKNSNSLNGWVTHTITEALNYYKNASFVNNSNLLDKQEFLTRMENIKKELLKKMLTKAGASSTKQLHLTVPQSQQKMTTNSKKGVAQKQKQHYNKMIERTKDTKGKLNSKQNSSFSLGKDKKSTKPRYNKIVSPSGKEEVFVYEVIEVVHHGNASKQPTETLNTTKNISLSKPTMKKNTNSSNIDIKAKTNIHNNNIRSKANRNGEAEKTKTFSKVTNFNRALIQKIKRGMISKGTDIGNLVQNKRKTETQTQASQDSPINRSTTASNRKKPSQINTINQTIKTNVKPEWLSITIPGENQLTSAQMPSNSKNRVDNPSSYPNNNNIDASLNNQMNKNIESTKHKMNARKKDANSPPTTPLTGKILPATPLSEPPLAPPSRYMTHLDEAKILAIRKHLVRMLQQINGHIAATRTKHIELRKQQNELSLLDKQKEKNIQEQTPSRNIVKNSETTENGTNGRHFVTESLTGVEPGIHQTNQEHIKASKPTTLSTVGKPTVHSIIHQNSNSIPQTSKMDIKQSFNRNTPLQPISLENKEAVLPMLPKENRNLKPQNVLPNSRSSNILLNEIRPSNFKPAFNNFIDVEFLNPGETLHRLKVSEVKERVKNKSNAASADIPADLNLKQPPLGIKKSSVKESSSALTNQKKTLQSNIIDNGKHTNINSQKKMLTKNLQALLKMSDMLLAEQDKMRHDKLLPGPFNEPLKHNQGNNMNGFMQNIPNQPNTNGISVIPNKAKNTSPQGQADFPKSGQPSNHTHLSSFHSSQSSWNMPIIRDLSKLRMPFDVGNKNNHKMPQNMLDRNRMPSNFRNQVFAEHPLPNLNNAIIEHMKNKSRNTQHVGLPENQSDRHLLGNALMLDHVNNYFRNKYSTDHIKGSNHQPNSNTVSSQRIQNDINGTNVSNVKQHTVPNSAGGSMFPIYDHSSFSDQKLTDFKSKMFAAQAGKTSPGAMHISGRNIQDKWVTDNKYNDITPNFPVGNKQNGMFFLNDRIFNVGPHSPVVLQKNIGSHMKTETSNMQPINTIDLQFLNPGKHTSAVHKPVENGTTRMASNSLSLTNQNNSNKSEFVAYNHLQRKLDNWNTPSSSFLNEHGNHGTPQQTVSNKFHNSYHNLAPGWNSKWPSGQVPVSKRLTHLNQITPNLHQASPIQSQIPQNLQQLSQNHHQSSPNHHRSSPNVDQISPNHNQISRNQHQRSPSQHQPSNSNNMINQLPTQRTRTTKQSSVQQLIPKVSLQFSSNRPVSMTGNVLPTVSGFMSHHNWNRNTNQNTNNVHSFQSRGRLDNPSISGHITENKMTRSGKDASGNVWLNHRKMYNSFTPDSTSNNIPNGADAASQILNSVFSNNILSQSSRLGKEMLRPITTKKWYSYILNV